MDEFEQASGFEQLRRDLAIKMRKPEGPAATGCCLFCDTKLPEGLRWCDKDCLDDWNKDQRAEIQRPICE